MQSVDRSYDIGTPIPDTSIPLNQPLKPAKSNLTSLASVWARRYLAAVSQSSRLPAPTTDGKVLLQPMPQRRSDRATTAAKLTRIMRHTSAQAWAKTEALLTEPLNAHGVDPELINPWEISQDVHQLFERVIRAYRQATSVQAMSRHVGNDCGRLRWKYTQADPRTIGFISMQAHYTGQGLLSHLNDVEQQLFAPYIKVIDDHLYLPLRDTYIAAAKHAPDSDAVRAVQALLPVTTRIARKVCKRVSHLNPGYASHTGQLAADAVRASSIRDVEMFQIYLCLCLLEGNVRSVQEQLFPVCVMLYPRLRVSWKLVQEMLEVMGWEMHKRLLPGDMMQFLPYLRTLSHMFSEEVFDVGM